MAVTKAQPKKAESRRRRRKRDTVENAVEVCKIAIGEKPDPLREPVENTILYELMQEEQKG